MLQQFTDWLFGLVKDAFLGLLDLIKDAFVWIVGQITDVLVALLAAIPVPDFLRNGLAAVFSGLSGDILWILGACGLSEALAIIGAGYAFRLTRKVVTLFQW